MSVYTPQMRQKLKKGVLFPSALLPSGPLSLLDGLIIWQPLMEDVLTDISKKENMKNNDFFSKKGNNSPKKENLVRF